MIFMLNPCEPADYIHHWCVWMYTSGMNGRNGKNVTWFSVTVTSSTIIFCLRISLNYDVEVMGQLSSLKDGFRKKIN